MDKKTMLQTHGLAGLYGMIDPAMKKRMMGIPDEDETSKSLTGQLMSVGQAIKTKDGRELFAIFGVVALPKGVLKDLHKYPVAGIIRDSHIDIIFSTEEGENREDTRGMGIAGCMKSEEWKI